MTDQPNMNSVAPDAPVTERLEALIENISAYIEYYHRGSVELVDFDGKTLKVEMGGACVGCPLSPHTLRGWVEGTARQFFPDLKEVVEITTLDN
jgi:Fe-S cluster biogenesis protein NfuA